jgi:TolB-like protein/Flp pilus assembly protein TadD
MLFFETASSILDCTTDRAGAGDMVEAGETTVGAGARTAFISYASQDEALAHQVVNALERAGVSCWIAPRDVVPGALYASEIVRGINECQIVVLVLSANSAASTHVGKELERASSKNRRIIALRIDAALLPSAFEYFLSESQWIEAAGVGIGPAAARLVDAVQRHLSSGSAPTSAAVVSAGARNAPGDRSSPRDLMLGAAALLAMLAIGAVWKFWPAKEAITAQTSDTPAVAAARVIEEASIAVLPFVNMSSDKEQEYFADGLSEELLNQLAQIPKLRVIGRTSSFSFKGKNEDLRKIGEMLGVNHILEGSVRRSGGQLRITAQLINPADGSHLWSETYNRELKNVFEIQDEIAMAVSQKLQLTINGSDKVGGTLNVAAYEAFLVGVSKSRTAIPELLLEANAHLQEATRLDPNFELAWATQLTVNFSIIDMIPAERTAARERVASLFQRALNTAPTSIAATMARNQQAITSGDFSTALGILRAVSTQSVVSSSGEASRAYGLLQLALGEPTAAIETFASAHRKDPLVGLHSTFKMIAYDMAGQSAMADKEYQVALAAPTASIAVTELSALAMAMGRRDRVAIERLLPRAIEAGSAGALANQVALKYLDDAPSARRALRELSSVPGTQGAVLDLAAMAQWAAYFGDDVLALEILQRLSKSGTGFQGWGHALWRPVNASTRRLSGFKTLVRDLKLVNYWRKSGKWNEFCKPVGNEDFECR